jgi:uncharacterized protein
MDPFRGSAALITGASSGIGREFARQLARHARALILVARRADRLEELRAELARPGLAIRCHAADLGDAAELEALLAQLAAGGETIDLLINNAGSGDHGLFEESDWERVKAMLDVNVRALTRLTHALLPGLVRARRGAIINVSSIASYLPLPQMAVYAATKAYVTSFSEAIRAEVRGAGVSVTALCPGPVSTEFRSVAERAGAPDKMPAPEIFKVPVEQVVREALAAAARRRARVVPGRLVRFVMTLTTLVPFAVMRPFIRVRRPR